MRHRSIGMLVAAVMLLTAVPSSVAAAVVKVSLVCTPAGVTQSSAAVLAANVQTHAAVGDAQWSSASVSDIALKSSLTIDQPGTYRLHGTIADGQIVVNSTANGVVRLILAGVSITSGTAAAIDILAAPKVIVFLQAGTNNVLVDGPTRSPADTAAASLYSRAPLTILGTGALQVRGRHADAIASTHGVLITGGRITAKAADDGIRGRDFVYVSAGTVTVDAVSDGLRSVGKDASTVGYVYIGGGRVHVTAGAAALHGLSDVVIAGGSLHLKSVGNGITSNCVSYISKANIVITAGAKAVHSNGELVIRSGTLLVPQAVEGLEGASVLISGGTVKLKTSDDGINVTTGPVSPVTNVYSNSVAPLFALSGGTVLIDALGDGVDINGSGTLSGGKLMINGPSGAKDNALDTPKPIVVSGGVILGVGPSAFATAPDIASPQSSLLGTLATLQPAHSVLLISEPGGKVLAAFATARPWQSVVFTSPRLRRGLPYQVHVARTSTRGAFGAVRPVGYAKHAKLVGTFTAGAYQNATPAP